MVFKSYPCNHFTHAGVDAGRVALEPVRAEPAQRVTHLTYAVRER